MQESLYIHIIITKNIMIIKSCHTILTFIALFFGNQVLSISEKTLDDDKTGLKALFIGNFYTTKGVPIHLQKLAETHGLTLDFTSVNPGRSVLYNLIKKYSVVSKYIRKGGWDVIILQEPRWLCLSNLVCHVGLPHAKKNFELIKKHNPNAKIQWYLSWGRMDGEKKFCVSNPAVCTFEEEQDELTKAYKTFACLFKPGTIAPVGEAYRLYKIAYGYDLFTDLYRPDGSYPSLQGQYLSACVNFSTMFGHLCLGNSYTAGLDEEIVKGLQTTADAAVSKEEWKYNADSDCNLSRCDFITK